MFEERHGQPQRIRAARRQILRYAGRHLHPARPCRLGARFQSRPHYRGHLPDAARRILCRQRAAQARDTALATASAEMKWLNGFSLAAIFEGEFSDVTRSYAGKGVVRYAW